MYQSSIRDKKKHKHFHNYKELNYQINNNEEEYAYVKKLLGNCRIEVITNSGIDAIGVIRGSMRKFNTRVLIEVGDIVVASKRDYQMSKVDIVHKFNNEQVLNLIAEKQLSTILSSYYEHSHVCTKNEEKFINNDNSYIDFGEISSDASDD